MTRHHYRLLAGLVSVVFGAQLVACGGNDASDSTVPVNTAPAVTAPPAASSVPTTKTASDRTVDQTYSLFLDAVADAFTGADNGGAPDPDFSDLLDVVDEPAETAMTAILGTQARLGVTYAGTVEPSDAPEVTNPTEGTGLVRDCVRDTLVPTSGDGTRPPIDIRTTYDSSPDQIIPLVVNLARNDEGEWVVVGVQYGSVNFSCI